MLVGCGTNITASWPAGLPKNGATPFRNSARHTNQHDNHPTMVLLLPFPHCCSSPARESGKRSTTATDQQQSGKGRSSSSTATARQHGVSMVRTSVTPNSRSSQSLTAVALTALLSLGSSSPSAVHLPRQFLSLGSSSPTAVLPPLVFLPRSSAFMGVPLPGEFRSHGSFAPTRVPLPQEFCSHRSFAPAGVSLPQEFCSHRSSAPT